jgi:Tfp pilus assembly protein PilO
MTIKNRQDFLVVLTIAAVALFAGVNFVFTPLEGWWAGRQQQIKDLREQVKEGNTLIAREKVDRGHWSDMESNALPANMSQAEQQFLNALDGWSRDSGAQITSIMPQWKIDSTNYMTLNCRVESDGDLGTLSRFVYDIEKGPLALRLDSVELSARDNSGQQMTLGVEINGLALLQNEKK